MVLKWSHEHFRLNNYIGASFGISRNLTEAKWELKVNKNGFIHSICNRTYQLSPEAYGPYIPPFSVLCTLLQILKIWIS